MEWIITALIGIGVVLTTLCVVHSLASFYPKLSGLKKPYKTLFFYSLLVFAAAPVLAVLMQLGYYQVDLVWHLIIIYAQFFAYFKCFRYILEEINSTETGTRLGDSSVMYDTLFGSWLDYIRQPVFITDNAGFLLYANTACQDHLRKSAKLLYGLGWKEYIPARDLQALNFENIAKLKIGQLRTAGFNYQAQDGRAAFVVKMLRVNSEIVINILEKINYGRN